MTCYPRFERSRLNIFDAPWSGKFIKKPQSEAYPLTDT